MYGTFRISFAYIQGVYIIFSIEKESILQGLQLQ